MRFQSVRDPKRPVGGAPAIPPCVTISVALHFSPQSVDSTRVRGTHPIVFHFSAGGPNCMPSLDNTRKNLARYGITWEEKCWLVYQFQKGFCALCLASLSVGEAAVDHFHGCGTHKPEDGCKKCIRGALHGMCNSPVLMYMERFPHLQSEHVRDYLARRPFVF